MGSATHAEKAAYDTRYCAALRLRDSSIGAEQAQRDVDERTRRARVVHAAADDASTVAIPLALALGALRILSWQLAAGVVIGSAAYKAARAYIEAPLHGPLL